MINKTTKYYEVIYILTPELSEDLLLKTIEKYQSLLLDSEVINLTTQNRGRRPFKYPIKNHKEGIYIQMNFEGKTNWLPLLQKAMKLDETILRSLTTKIKK